MFIIKVKIETHKFPYLVKINSLNLIRSDTVSQILHFKELQQKERKKERKKEKKKRKKERKKKEKKKEKRKELAQTAQNEN